MMLRRARALWWCMWLFLAGTTVLVGRDARAQPDHEEPQAGASEANLAEAKRLFKQGNTLRKAGNHQSALELFLQSRALAPSVPNILNAGICLSKLGRYDEAMETWEELLTQFDSDLTPSEREGLAEEMRKLQPKLANIEVVANEKGALVVDGRPRGDLPRPTPVRVLPGSHTVLIVKDGFEPFESTVSVAIGQTSQVVAKLRRLTDAGRLRIDDASLRGGTVSVDGAPLGIVPWEGTVAPGSHYVTVEKGDVGTAPTHVIVVAGQIAMAVLKPLRLGAVVRVTTEPKSAELRIGDVVVGKGQWTGRLPLGNAAISALEEGYRPGQRSITVTTVPVEVVLRLEIDSDHPRWGAVGRIWVDAFGGIGPSPSLGSGAEASCEEAKCTSDPLAWGFVAGLRGGYEFPFGASIEVAGGFMWARKSLAREFARDVQIAGSPAPAVYGIEDSITFGGPFAAAGVGYRAVFAPPFELRAHTLVGAIFASTKDDITGEVQSGDQRAAVAVTGTGASVNSADLFIMPELNVGVRFGGFGVGLGFAVPIVPLHTTEESQLDAQAQGCGGNPGTVACAQGQRLSTDERAHGAFVLLLPSLRIGHSF